MKIKQLIFLSLLALLSFAPHVFAQGFTALAPIPGLTDPTTANSILSSQSLSSFFNNLYKYLIGLAATLAVIEIIWAGIEIAFNKEDVSKLMDNKGRIYNAIFGLILVLSPYLVFSIINPSILNLSLNLPKIVLDIPAGGAGGGTTLPPATDPTTGCSVTGTAGIFQTAICPSDAAASTWLSSANCWRAPSSSCLANSSSGCTQTVQYCEGMSAPIAFINVGAKGTIYDDYLLQPLNAQQATPFQTFANDCASGGGVLCTAGLKSGGSVDCNTYGGYTTPLPATKSGKCYYTPAKCFSQKDAAEATSWIKANPLNTMNYQSCVPDENFILTPYQ